MSSVGSGPPHVPGAPEHRRLPGAREAVPLSGWPVLAPMAAYLLWWLLGVGDMIWLIAAAAMLYQWLGSRHLGIPRSLLLWGLFLVWCVASMVMIDTTGRLIGAVYRLLFYAAAACFAIHTYSARRALPLVRVTGAMTWFLACMTAGGYLALAMPELVIHTPMSWVVPQGLASNELVADMIVRRTTQWSPDLWEPQAVRPAAPFLYANTWGNVYSFVLPVAVLHLWLTRGARWWWAWAAVVAASVVPAVSTLNRGMFIGLGVVGAWAALQAVRRGRVLIVLAGVVITPLAGALWIASPSGQSLIHRLESTNSTVDRALLYRLTLEGALDSPLFGYGSPRPAPDPWLPSLGTQGQLWTVLYSNGFVGTALFLGCLLSVLALAWRRTDPVGAVMGGIVAATVVESLYYGMMTGLMVTMVAVGLVLRPDTAVGPGRRSEDGGEVTLSSRAQRRRTARRASSDRPRRRRS